MTCRIAGGTGGGSPLSFPEIGPLLIRHESWPDDLAVDPQIFVFVCAIDEHHAGNFFRVLMRVHPSNQSAPGVTGNYVRPFDIRSL